MSDRKKTSIFRIMHAINVFAAGIPGLLIVFFPAFAEQHVLWPAQDYGTMTILGSIWLAIGVVSALGTAYPHKFLSVFLIQFIYKTIWLMSYVLPVLLSNNQPPPALYIIAGIFVLLLVEVGLFIRPEDFRASSATQQTAHAS